MSGTQLLRLLVNERLAAAAEEICGLVEKTIAEYQDATVRSKREVIQLKKQIEQLTVLKPQVTLLRADTQLVSEGLVTSLHQYEIKETANQERPQVKEEQEEQCISPDMEADTSKDAEVRHRLSKPTSNHEQLPSSTSRTESVNESIDDKWDEQRQDHSVEVLVDVEPTAVDKKSCHFCGVNFRKDSHLKKHVAESHSGHKAFKCLDCNKEFKKRSDLVRHTRIHTGEKPFRCIFCCKTFTQNSSRIVHMRQHTGEKPYFCSRCGRSYASSKHFRYCKMQNESKIPPERGNGDDDPKDEKAFKCSVCDKEFKRKDHLISHERVHTGEKPYSCDFCYKTFNQNSSRIVHMRQHTGEKPYLCNKCGKSFNYSSHAKFCTGTQMKDSKRSFRCSACGRTFNTDSDLEVHMEVHQSWRRHITEKSQEQE